MKRGQRYALELGPLPAMGMGGRAQVLLHLAIRHPERIGETILISTAPYFPSQARALMKLSGPDQQSQEHCEEMRAKHGNSNMLYPVSSAISLVNTINTARLWILPKKGHCPVFRPDAKPLVVHPLNKSNRMF